MRGTAKNNKKINKSWHLSREIALFGLNCGYCAVYSSIKKACRYSSREKARKNWKYGSFFSLICWLGASSSWMLWRCSKNTFLDWNWKWLPVCKSSQIGKDSDATKVWCTASINWYKKRFANLKSCLQDCWFRWVEQESITLSICWRKH